MLETVELYPESMKDGIKIQKKKVRVVTLSRNAFGVVQETDPETGFVLSAKYKLKKEELSKIPGLRGLVISEMPDNSTTMTLDFTGKFIPEEYKNLINRDNIFKYIDNFNNLGLIEFDTAEFIRNSQVFELHSTIDVVVEEDPQNYLIFLKDLVSKIESKFWERDYENSKNLTIKRKTKTNRQSVTCYAKHQELKRKNKQSAAFRELLGPDGINVLMAKRYIDNLSEEVKKGQHQKAAQGEYPGKPPYGYYRLNHKKILVNQDEAKYVKRAFELYSGQNLSLTVVINKLYEEGFIYKSNKPKIGKSNLDVMMKNVFYIGQFKFKERIYEGIHEPIIDKQVFYNVQKAFKKDNKPEISTQG